MREIGYALRPTLESQTVRVTIVAWFAFFGIAVAVTVYRDHSDLVASNIRLIKDRDAWKAKANPDSTQSPDPDLIAQRVAVLTGHDVALKKDLVEVARAIAKFILACEAKYAALGEETPTDIDRAKEPARFEQQLISNRTRIERAVPIVTAAITAEYKRTYPATITTLLERARQDGLDTSAVEERLDDNNKAFDLFVLKGIATQLVVLSEKL